jgi:hypothetical protein
MENERLELHTPTRPVEFWSDPGYPGNICRTLPTNESPRFCRIARCLVPSVEVMSTHRGRAWGDPAYWYFDGLFLNAEDQFLYRWFGPGGGGVRNE